MYCGVPATTPDCVIVASSTARARPKSVILTRSTPFSSRMFAGLTSRWINPWACAAASPWAACMPMRRISRSSGGSPLVDPVLNRLAGDVLHDQVRDALRRRVDGMDGDDVLVDDRRGGLRLAGEPPPRRRRRGQAGRQHLDRHQPISARSRAWNTTPIPPRPTTPGCHKGRAGPDARARRRVREARAARPRRPGGSVAEVLVLDVDAGRVRRRPEQAEVVPVAAPGRHGLEAAGNSPGSFEVGGQLGLFGLRHFVVEEAAQAVRAESRTGNPASQALLRFGVCESEVNRPSICSISCGVRAITRLRAIWTAPGREAERLRHGADSWPSTPVRQKACQVVSRKRPRTRSAAQAKRRRRYSPSNRAVSSAAARAALPAAPPGRSPRPRSRPLPASGRPGG